MFDKAINIVFDANLYVFKRLYALFDYNKILFLVLHVAQFYTIVFLLDSSNVFFFLIGLYLSFIEIIFLYELLIFINEKMGFGSFGFKSLRNTMIGDE
ncbi:MAG: hypothetical protein AAGE61_14480 [Pseudomonadota bacterium]